MAGLHHLIVSRARQCFRSLKRAVLYGTESPSYPELATHHTTSALPARAWCDGLMFDEAAPATLAGRSPLRLNGIGFFLSSVSGGSLSEGGRVVGGLSTWGWGAGVNGPRPIQSERHLAISILPDYRSWLEPGRCGRPTTLTAPDQNQACNQPLGVVPLGEFESPTS